VIVWPEDANRPDFGTQWSGCGDAQCGALKAGFPGDGCLVRHRLAVGSTVREEGASADLHRQDEERLTEP